MNQWIEFADAATIEKIIISLKLRNINAFFVQTGKDAKERVLEMIPNGARVLAASSKTLEEIGVTDEIENTDNYNSIRKEYMGFNHESQADKIRISRSTPDYIVGSVNAITKKGEVVIASNTGSQLAAYASGAGKVIWVIGIQKVVDNFDEAFKRIYDYVLPLESQRLKELYGVASNVSQLLIFNKAASLNRITIIFVNQSLGF